MLLAVLPACQSAEPTTQPDSARAFRAAVQDAQTAEPSEIVTTLTPIVPSNDALRWRVTRTAAGDSARHVLMVTWTGDAPLASTRARPGRTLTFDDVVWVTAVPDVQQFCRSLDRTETRLDQRLRQRLGLRPGDASTRFIEMWVRPKHLARPCPDPAITDRECERQPPGPASLVTIDSTYRAWFTQHRAQEYGTDGYPWTRLGYTYDWNPTTDEVGTSEFIVRPGATVDVHAVTPTDAYCQ